MCGTNEEERTSGAFAVAPVRIEVSGSYAQDRFAQLCTVAYKLLCSGVLPVTSKEGDVMELNFVPRVLLMDRCLHRNVSAAGWGRPG